MEKHALSLQKKYFKFSNKSKEPEEFKILYNVFKEKYSEINSAEHQYVSNEVLFIIREPLLNTKKFYVETVIKNGNGKILTKHDLSIESPINLETGCNKKFNPDAMSENGHILVEVEAGQAVINHRFLKDFFESIIYTECEYLVIAVRNVYHTTIKKTGKLTPHYDYEKVCDFFQNAAKSRLKIPNFNGVLVIGY